MVLEYLVPRISFRWDCSLTQRKNSSVQNFSSLGAPMHFFFLKRKPMSLFAEFLSFILAYNFRAHLKIMFTLNSKLTG